jgi:glycosyltransferase involved in cell wall biosynthesis
LTKQFACDDGKTWMNVLIFSHSSGLGGAERSLLTLVRELIKTYHTQITVILPPDGPSIELLQNAGASILTAPINMWCTVDDVPSPETILNIQNQSIDWIIENRNELNELNPDIVLTNTIVIPWGCVAAALLNRPHIWMINEFGELDHGFNFFLPFNQILRVIENSSDMIVTRSNAIKDTLFPHLKPDKIRTIYRSIDLPIQKANHQSESAEQFLQGTTFRMGVIGTIRESKGQQDAVKAVIELVNNRNRQVELVMVGQADAPFRETLEQLAQDNGVDHMMHILPFQADIQPMINQADIVLVTSRMEAFGRVILESMLSGKPIIGTNTGGTPELIINGETGLLYEPGNIHQLADQIEKLIDDAALRQKLGRKGFEFAQSSFTKENYAGAFTKLFEELAQKNYQPKDEFSSYLLGLMFSLYDHKNADINYLKTQIRNLEQEVLFYSQSKSWRLTRPLRMFSRFLNRK